jgi:hypothetical protein
MDAQIHHDVLEELKWDSRVEETEVGVQVAGGVVTLTGTVTSWAKRLAAQEAAHRVIGVLDVANDITVKAAGGLTRTDTEIAQAVLTCLLHSLDSVADGGLSEVFVRRENGLVVIEDAGRRKGRPGHTDGSLVTLTAPAATLVGV